MLEKDIVQDRLDKLVSELSKEKEAKYAVEKEADEANLN